MKISPLAITRKVGLATLAAGMLSACSAPVADKTKEYFQDKPRVEYEEFVNDCEVRDLSSVQSQAKLDSLAYRELFNSTDAVNNSAIVKEYNKIAKTAINADSYQEVSENLEDTGVSSKEFDRIMDSCTDKHLVAKYVTSRIDYPEVQHKTDSIAYRQFFEKHNLLDVDNLEEFKKITEEIRPY